MARVTTRRARGLGVLLMASASALTLAACMAMPPATPDDPDIPGQTTPAFPNLTDPPTTQGPTDPPVPTTAPGEFSYGDTVTIHTQMGSTWEITPIASTDPADDALYGAGYSPMNGRRFVMLEVTVTNVGVVTTHPYYDMMFAYQPDDGPTYDQNSAATAAAPDDLGYSGVLDPGTSYTGQVVVQVPEDAPTGSWVISGDNGQTEYRFR